MPSLEERLRELADAGNFSHLSIISRTDGTFAASFTPSTQWGQGNGAGTDPVSAALNAIETAPKGRKDTLNKRVHSPAAHGKSPSVGSLLKSAPTDIEPQANEPAKKLTDLF
jgi:hypothetical protein